MPNPLHKIRSLAKPAGFSDSVHVQKNERIARSCLNDLMVFHQALEDEINMAMDMLDKADEHARLLLEKMLDVKTKYALVMQNLRESPNSQECHALIVFADALQDMMACLHHQKRH